MKTNKQDLVSDPRPPINVSVAQLCYTYSIYAKWLVKKAKLGSQVRLSDETFKCSYTGLLWQSLRPAKWVFVLGRNGQSLIPYVQMGASGMKSQFSCAFLKVFWNTLNPGTVLSLQVDSAAYQKREMQTASSIQPVASVTVPDALGRLWFSVLYFSFERMC